MIVTFSYSAWSTRYPEFAAVSSGLAQAYFDEACMYCDNTDASMITDVGQRTTLLNMLTAHICSLNAVAMGGRSAENVVGRIASASEGSVSVSFDNVVPGNAAWYQQTKYGAAYWQATVMYRKAQLFPGKCRIVDPWQRRFV